jgi:hypothetical protein
MTSEGADSETGMAMIGMIAARHFCRNRITTMTTRIDRLEQRVHDRGDGFDDELVGL